MQNINIIGGGLAGSEAAIYLANKGYTVNLYEMRPKKTTGAHTTADFAEFVCSNSLGSIALTSASGLLKKEIEILGSSLICLAKEHSVPSGNSLSIDRFGFSAAVSDIIRNHENINIINEEITEIPVSADTITLVATGPLTSSALSNAIKNAFGEEHFSFFDAVAPIVKKDSINFDTAFFGARWGKGDDDFINCPMEKDDYEKFYDILTNADTIELKAFEKDILNCVVNSTASPEDFIKKTLKEPPSVPIQEFTKLLSNESCSIKSAEDSNMGTVAQSSNEVALCNKSQQTPASTNAAENSFLDSASGISKPPSKTNQMKPKYFEGCMPIEVMAKRGKDTLRFGPMKPVGLFDRRKFKDEADAQKYKKQQFYAVVQLRQDDKEANLYNLVGFQTNLKWGEQKKLIHSIPGLENAEITRYGVMHANTFINSPKILNKHLQATKNPNLFFAGQITGVEGYTESIATGLFAAINMERFLKNEPLIELDSVSMLGALVDYITFANHKNFQPVNSNWGIVKEMEIPKKIRKNKEEKNTLYSNRAIEYINNLKNVL